MVAAAAAKSFSGRVTSDRIMSANKRARVQASASAAAAAAAAAASECQRARASREARNCARGRESRYAPTRARALDWPSAKVVACFRFILKASPGERPALACIKLIESRSGKGAAGPRRRHAAALGLVFGKSAALGRIPDARSSRSLARPLAQVKLATGHSILFVVRRSSSLVPLVRSLARAK